VAPEREIGPFRKQTQVKQHNDEPPKRKSTKSGLPQGESGDSRSADSHTEATPSENAIVQSIGPEGPPPPDQNDRGPKIAAAFQHLSMMLQLASEYDPNQPDHGRSSARIALIGVMNFLAVLLPQLDTLPLALQDLLQGLVDLDQGRVVPLLARADLRGAPPTSFSDALLRGLAAAALTCLVDGREMQLKEAAAYVARRLNGLGYGPKRLSGVQVSKWREKLTAPSVKEGPAAQRYQLALKLVEGKAPIPAVDSLLTTLRAMHPANFPKKGTF
jgi:hypothetical protein